MTANNDKKSAGDGFVTVNKPSIIWICRDSGDEEGGKPPEDGKRL